MRRRPPGRGAAGRAGRAEWLAPALLAALLGLAALPALAEPAAASAGGTAGSAAGAPALAVSLEPDTLTVGDRVRATLTLTADPSELAGEPRFPTWGKAWGTAEILDVSAPARRATDDGRVEYRQTVVLTAFRPGRVPLPPRKVAVPGPRATRELATPEKLALRVESVLPAPGEGAAGGGARAAAIPEPKPPAPPRALPLGGAFWWTLAVMSLAAAGALGLAFARGRSRAGAGASAARRPALPPADELAASLAEVEREESLERAHVALSFALRRYLGRSLGFPALESTTSEVRRELRGRRAPEPVAARAAEVLRACDRVKFAREPSGRPALEARLEAAREIADRLEAHLSPPPGSPARGAAAAAGKAAA